MSDFFDREGDRAYTRDYKETTPDVLAAFTAFNDSVFAPEGREIPLKFRELIALAVGITTQCTYCIDGHSQAAVRRDGRGASARRAPGPDRRRRIDRRRERRAVRSR